VTAIHGHDRVLERLRAAAAADRLPHALLFSGPEGVGKRTVATAFARELVAGEDAADADRFDRGAHEGFLLYSDVDKPLPVRRGDLLEPGRDEAALLGAYGILQNEGWIAGVTAGASGPDVVDRLTRNAEVFLGRRGIPFADVLERALAGLERSRKAGADAVEVARRIFSPGTSRTFYRRSLGIELINGRGDGAHFRTVSSMLRTRSAAGWRVVVVDDAHKMTDEAENAFLKTLEEPPPRTLLVLVTSEPLSLLPTTLSRCARVVFDAVPPPALARFLATQAVPAAEARLLAALAGGSCGLAIELRGLDLAERTEFVSDLLAAIATGDLQEALALAGGRIAGGETRAEARVLLELLALALRDLVVAGFATDLASGIPPDRVRALAARLPTEAWLTLFERTELALSDLDANVEPRLAVEALFAEALPAAGAAA